jgi:Tagatose-1,6-bisphosphate aldolase
LDPVYGLPGAKARDEEAGLLLAYEKTGYDNTVPGRLPDLIDDLSAKRIVDEGADGVKLLVYYDVENQMKLMTRKKHLLSVSAVNAWAKMCLIT